MAKRTVRELGEIRMARTNTRLLRAAAAVLWALAVLTVGGCGKAQEPNGSSAVDAAPLLGAYRAPDGAVVEFLADGRFRTSGATGGRFTVEGNRVALDFNNGKARTGERLGPDVVRLDAEGMSVKFYRLGSAAAQTPEATQAPPPPPEPSKPAPDRSVPLSDYVPLTEPDALPWLAAAFSERPLTDDEKLMLVPGTDAVADAFARKNLVDRELPALTARLASLKKSRYVRFTATTAPSNGAAADGNGAGAVWLVGGTSGGRVVLGPYDLDKKGFPVPCLNRGSLASFRGGASALFPFEGPERGCLLPVPDEAVARALEAARVKFGGFYLRADVYAFVAGANAGSLALVPVRLVVSVLDPADAGRRAVLGTATVEL